MRGTRMWFLLFLVLALAHSAAAQVQFGSFVGTVTDASDAVIPGAKVTVTNVGTGLRYEVTTDDTGRYRFNELPPGRYRIAASASGFKVAELTGLILNAGTVSRVDVKMEVGAVTETMTVESTPALIQTEDSRLTETVQGSQIVNLPLDGRNVYDLIRLAPGANDVRGVSFENGNETVINGLRPNFSGFLINGSSNKGLSGGVVTRPNPDIVEEFQMVTLNMSAQYGNSAAAVVNLVTKSGTNDFHGTAFWFTRHDEFDATDFFINRAGEDKPNLQFNQFGGTVTGPILKDKMFFTASWQAERFLTSGTPTPLLVESDEWINAVTGTLNPTGTASLLYNTFPVTTAKNAAFTLDEWITGGNGSGLSYEELFCVDTFGFDAANPLNPTSNQAAINLATRFASWLGVTATEATNVTANCSMGVAAQAGLLAPFGGRNIPFMDETVSIFGVQEQGNLFDGNEWSSRIDYVRQNDRIFGEFYWLTRNDEFGPEDSAKARSGILTPRARFLPNFQASWVHTFNPSMINEAKVGFTRNRDFIGASDPGVPDVNFDSGEIGFGAYNGYPQFFVENIHTYSDMLSINKGKHNLKMGVDFRRNIENSEFNVARPSYYFFDNLFFAADEPYEQAAGVDPGFVTNSPAQLATNIRHWRNLEMGLFFQDDWKVTRNFTLNLGIRYDWYGRHREAADVATTFIPGPGGVTRTTEGFLEWISNANAPCTDPRATLAGVCGPGGFARTKALGGSDLNNFGPRIGFAWDLFGNGKTALRGGFGVSYEGTLYNPLSNSRWNPPFYSFNISDNYLLGDAGTIIYGPTTCAANSCMPDPLTTPTFSGPATNPGQGVGFQAAGNLSGWAPFNPQLAFLTGVVFPQGIRDPYVTNYYFSVQHEILPKTVLEVNYVGTQGYKLFKAENANRVPGSFLPMGLTALVQGRTLTGLGRRFLNPNYGRLRVWANISRSWYDALQVSVRKAMSHGFMVNANYTWSHSIDTGSTWHSGSTTANGASGGEGFSSDHTLPLSFDRGNSIFDIRHRFQFNYLWELPWYKEQQGVIGKILGGWQWNGIWTWQSGAHWSAFHAQSNRLSCSNPADYSTCFNARGDFNLDGESNDRPNAPNGIITNVTTGMWADGFFNVAGSQFGCAFDASGTCAANGMPSFFGAPCVACNGDLGRNVLIGPSLIETNMSFFKNFRLTEDWKLQFRFEMLNAFNHTNFRLPNGASGGNQGNRINSSSFGQADGTQGPRRIQFGLKLIL